ncbi:hypothetical protein Aple_000500 [Acrocarpospora pleiomorpha]|uniref:Uncharacterized protein n=1 Tax=Acrocarpospora pleiomorpha TaxID=90975 RepID=A0A5M3X656_9ACTN|nr:hypothetical protein Aple_000500 [Acrocarpospora pleiomorpha]
MTEHLGPAIRDVGRKFAGLRARLRGRVNGVVDVISELAWATGLTEIVRPVGFSVQYAGGKTGSTAAA